MTRGKEIKRVMMGVCSVTSGLVSIRPRKATISVVTPRGGCWPGTTSRKVGVFTFQEDEHSLASAIMSPEAVLDLEHLFQCSRKANTLALVRVSVKAAGGETHKVQTTLDEFLMQLTWLGRGVGFHLFIEDGGLRVKPLLRINDKIKVRQAVQNDVSLGPEVASFDRENSNTEDMRDTLKSSTESVSYVRDNKLMINEMCGIINIPMIVDLTDAAVLDLNDEEMNNYKNDASSTDNEPSVVNLVDYCDVYFDNEMNDLPGSEAELNNDCLPITIEGNNLDLPRDRSYCIKERINIEDATRVEESHDNSHCRRGHEGGTVFKRVVRYISRAFVITMTVIVLTAVLDPLLPPLDDSPIEWF